MEMSFEIDRQQLKELDKLFKTLPKRLQSNAMKTAYRDASKPLKKAIKSQIPSFKLRDGISSSILSKSIGTVVRRGKGDKNLYAVVGPLINKGGWFGHWLEFGTLAKRSEPLKRKRSEKAQRAADKGLGLDKSPFMRTATLQATPAVQKVLRFAIVKAIEDQLNKTLKKGKL